MPIRFWVLEIQCFPTLISKLHKKRQKEISRMEVFILIQHVRVPTKASEHSRYVFKPNPELKSHVEVNDDFFTNSHSFITLETTLAMRVELSTRSYSDFKGAEYKLLHSQFTYKDFDGDFKATIIIVTCYI